MCGNSEERILVWALEAIADGVADSRLAKWAMEKHGEEQERRQIGLAAHLQMMNELHGSKP